MLNQELRRFSGSGFEAGTGLGLVSQLQYPGVDLLYERRRRFSCLTPIYSNVHLLYELLSGSCD